jgi:hypothetical protein
MDVKRLKEGTMKRTIPTIATLALLAIAPAAQAQSPSEGYGGVIAETVTPAQPKATTPTAAQAPTSSALPFTGLDAAAVALGGVLLLGAGGALRHVTRRRVN